MAATEHLERRDRGSIKLIWPFSLSFRDTSLSRYRILPSGSYAGTGLSRNPPISRRTSPQNYLGTATSAVK
jgi:hypothetical protein